LPHLTRTKHDNPARDWEFWIDVGGTFTDCLARRPDGSIITHKLLSTGVYQGTVKPGSSRERIVDTDRRCDPPDYFRGYTLRLGADSAKVASFAAETGRFTLDHPLAQSPPAGTAYELVSDEQAPVAGIRWLMGKRLSDDIGPISVRLGTTRGTNALLERQGARTGFVTTSGFRDVLRIAYQNRPHLFDLRIRKPAELYEDVLEVTERIDKDGHVIKPIDEQQVREGLKRLRDNGIKSLAICLMNAYRNDRHERVVERIARQVGFEHVSRSVSRLQKIVSRGDTTVVDAYLTPIIREYLANIVAKIPHASLKLMTSAGGLVDAENFVGKDSVLSGPAGGVVGQAYVAQQAGFEKAIGFDMGGTSTDVSHFNGRFERRYEMEVNDPESDSGVRIAAPMLAIETVAAGGGSICWFDGQKPMVGPRSAGADPGPACYGRGGPLCVTDVNLFLGRILPEHFAFPLDRRAVELRLQELVEQVASGTGQRYSLEELATGLAEIANANMAAPIKKISIARGYDVREYLLVSFGGAGAQHACSIARELGIRTVLQHPYAGILSAFGMGMADVKKFAARDVSRPYEVSELAALELPFHEMEEDLIRQVLDEGIGRQEIRPAERILELRYVGQDATIPVTCPADGDYRREFERQHQKLYGFVLDRPLEIYAARMELTGATAKPTWPIRPVRRRRLPKPQDLTRTFFHGQWRDTGVFIRADLEPGDVIAGPAIIVENVSTVVVEPGWDCAVTERDDLLLTDHAGAPAKEQIATEVDAITLELFNNRFAAIAEQMGATLQKTALAVNIKERLDFSCAIFDRQGDLVVNAPHIPVHLGAMSECVKCLIEDVPDMCPGDVFVTNDPFRGGSHLPDVTVVTPVFSTHAVGGDGAEQIQFFAASRAHHAEIGGITPGSMPAWSRNLAEEGVLIRKFRLVNRGQARHEALRELLLKAPFPSRCVHENIADIDAQVAANKVGVDQLVQLVHRYGAEVVQSYMQHIQRTAEMKMATALLQVRPGQHHFSDHLDDGTQLDVTISIHHTVSPATDVLAIHEKQLPYGRAVVDFSGTGPVSPGNLNTPRAVVASAVLYCFRCLIDEDIPLNAGVLAPIEIRLPDNCLLNPRLQEDPARCAAVVGGNVETSQRVVDVIFGALGVVAASQGTMNNFIFGRSGEEAFGYYETICGGTGAGPDFDGADAVHSHMTNTRLTDPEVLEDRYPVRLMKFAIRDGSGGDGRHRGGEGIIRQVEFLEPLTVSLLTQRRRRAPYGVHGGRAGAVGHNLLRRAGSTEDEDLGSANEIEVDRGDIVTIMTPGGGGYGRAQR
jgi:5-oxoprolinase (ATP-hydrolysing)